MLRLYEQWYAFYKLYKLDAHVMKESLNSYGQQFYQYQQSEKPPLTSTRWTYDVEKPGPGLEQAQKYGGVKPVNGIPILVFFLGYFKGMYNYIYYFKVTFDCGRYVLLNKCNRDVQFIH